MNSGENVEVKEVTYLEKLHFQKEREKLKTFKVILERGPCLFKISFPFL